MSENVTQVKQKEANFKAFVKAVGPFRMVADVWCAAVSGTPLTPRDYHAALDVVDKPVRFKKASEGDGFHAAAQQGREKLACFHWQLDFPEAFFDDHGPQARPGFDAIIGNPPYEVLSELESGQDLSAFRAFIDREPAYAPSKRGKNNLYKLFICRALDVLADGGRLGFITPMALLGDDQAADLRREMVRQGYFTAIEAFPQKDDPTRRVFPEAKLSTALFTLVKSSSDGSSTRPFVARVHPGQFIEEASPSLTLTTAAIPLYDPNNFTIVSCGQADWDLATRIMQSGRLGRLQDFAVFFQGEVNETNERARGNLTNIEHEGHLVTRGASICLYVVRPASQVADLLLNVASFLRGKAPDTKAYHHRYERVGLQESSPQNNFRRIIAAIIPVGEFCNHTVNYCTDRSCTFDLRFVAALLNNRLSDWYFRLGSTNAHVSHYQLYNLPCPVFALTVLSRNETKKALEALVVGRPDEALGLMLPLVAKPPFDLAVQQTIVAAVHKIISIESDRGEIARTARSALDPAAQPYQDLIDQLFYGMAGLSSDEVKGLEERYATML